MKAEIQKSPFSAAVALLAAIFSLAIGWLDLYATEVSVTIISLLIAGGLFGLIQPAAAWRWAIILAVGLPAMEVVGRLLRPITPEPIRVDPRIALVASAFALIGCYVGVAIRRFVSVFGNSV